MKNKRLYKYLFVSLRDILFALILTYITAAIIVNIGKVIYRLLRNSITDGIISRFFYFFADIFRRDPSINIIETNSLVIGLSVTTILKVIVFAIIYTAIIYKKNKSLVAVIEEAEIMASGDLDRVIKVKTKGDIKNLAENINNISKQLKDITIAERNAQNTKNDLITNVSHDLRTPLTSVIGYLEIIDTDQYKDEVALRYYANIAYEKSKTLNLLINDLFELTKIQNSTINLDKVDINLVELIGQVVACFEYQFQNAKMQSRINFSNDKLIVNADAGKLVRAFENLLSNAIKYGQDGHYVDVVTKIEGEIAVIQIINYGQSIPEVHLPYIFDRFYRVETSRNSKIGGSGLGLAITKNIIELHQGTILAYSDNKRTIFEVRLPVKSLENEQ